MPGTGGSRGKEAHFELEACGGFLQGAGDGHGPPGGQVAHLGGEAGEGSRFLGVQGFGSPGGREVVQDLLLRKQLRGIPVTPAFRAEDRPLVDCRAHKLAESIPHKGYCDATTTSGKRESVRR
jgi:hypothetical protein